MKFSDFSKDYDKVFPRVVTVASKVVETTTKPKDIEKEINEELIDNSMYEVEKVPQKEEVIEESGRNGELDIE